MRLPIAVVIPALALAVVAPGCGGDDPDGLASGGDFSVEAALAELPVPEGADDQLVIVSVVDLAGAEEANGAERPTSGDPEDEARWLRDVSGGVTEEGEDFPPAFVPPVEVAGWSHGARPDEVRDELGWSLLDVDSLAEVAAPPFRFAVVTGEVDESTFDDADVEDLGDGVVSAGGGEDGETDLDGVTAARPIGTPLRMAAEDGRLAASSSTDAVEGWLGGEAETLAEDEDLSAVAAALDDGEAITALFALGDLTARPVLPGGDEAPEALEPVVVEEEFSAVGIGWGAEDGESVVTVAYAFADEGTAEDAVDQVETAFADGVSVQTARPLSDLVTVGEVRADGAVVVARLTIPDGSRPQVVADLLTLGEGPFTHA